MKKTVFFSRNFIDHWSIFPSFRVTSGKVLFGSMLVGSCLTVNVSLSNFKKRNIKHESSSCIKRKSCPLISEKDPSFYNFCEEIRKRSNIQEHVVFKFYNEKSVPEHSDAIAFYSYKDRVIYIREDYYRKNKSRTQKTVAHELAHFKQGKHDRYPESYHGSNSKLKETYADAEAAALIRCKSCLESIIKGASKKDSKKGYFSAFDYQPYLERLLKNPKICEGCRKKNKSFGAEKDEWQDYLVVR